MQSGDAVSNDDLLAMTGLRSLAQRSQGSPLVKVGVIDGPVDLRHPAFSSAVLRTVRPDQSAMCSAAGSGECYHGTAVAGILFANRGTPAPAICPGCSILLYPLFPEHQPGSPEFRATTPAQLSHAIIETVDAGAMIINLSLGIITSDVAAYREVDEACEYASRRGVILVAASGNQGRIGFLPLLNHPWIIPVAACNPDGSPTAESNISPTIGARGFCAPGANVYTTTPAGAYAGISGTSVAAAFVTGALALVWSETPGATAAEIRQCAYNSAPRARRTLVPPLFNAESALKLSRVSTKSKEVVMADEKRQDEGALNATSQATGVLQAQSAKRVPVAGSRTPSLKADLSHGGLRRGVRIAGQLGEDGSCPTCSGGSGGPAMYVYAIGSIKWRFPSPGVEKEFLQTMAQEATANLSDQQAVFNTLRQNRHLANEVCWVFSVENVDAYILVPRDIFLLDEFIQASAPGPRGIDVDVIVGVRGSMAPPEMCNGLVVPVVLVDRTYSFNRNDLVNAIQKPETSDMSDEAFRSVNDELFDRIQQLADNVGASDEHRALNYLAVRYQQIYTHTSNMNGRDFSLTAVEIVPSRLSTTRKLVNVVFTYTNRGTDVAEKFAVRVDVTEKYPFLDKKLSPYFERD